MDWFKADTDRRQVMKDKTYEEVYKEWGSNCKKVTYKNRVMWVTALKRAKDNKVFYIGTFCDLKFNSSSIESIYYDKGVSRFQKFVDEYCIYWQARAQVPYKAYVIEINQERNKEFYIGIVQFHKNSTFKHIADTREEVEKCCKNRIGKVVYEKEKVQKKGLTPKQEKIQELEQLQARISAQLEELKKEKETFTYKGVVLEYGKEEGLEKDYMIGRIKNAPEGTRYFYRKVASNMQCDFEEYIDELEEAANLYCALTGKEFYINSSR